MAGIQAQNESKSKLSVEPTPVPKFKNFLWLSWFVGKNLSNIVSPACKFDNPYCHNEGEQIGGAKNCQLTRLSQQLELKTYFNQWRDLADLAAKQRRKAEFYYRFTTLEKCFKNWKVFNKQEKEKRARKKWIKAVAFDDFRLMR